MRIVLGKLKKYSAFRMRGGGVDMPGEDRKRAGQIITKKLLLLLLVRHKETGQLYYAWPAVASLSHWSCPRELVDRGCWPSVGFDHCGLCVIMSPCHIQVLLTDAEGHRLTVTSSPVSLLHQNEPQPVRGHHQHTPRMAAGHVQVTGPVGRQLVRHPDETVWVGYSADLAGAEADAVEVVVGGPVRQDEVTPEPAQEVGHARRAHVRQAMADGRHLPHHPPISPRHHLQLYRLVQRVVAARHQCVVVQACR